MEMNIELKHTKKLNLDNAEDYTYKNYIQDV